MSRIAIIGDVHLSDRSPMFEAQVQLLQWLIDTHKDDHVIFTGDFWHTSSPHWERAYNTGLDCLLQFKDAHLISGNHEMLSSGAKSHKGNLLKPLKDRYSNLHIYLEPEAVTIVDSSFLMLPFLYDRHAMVEQYEALKWSGDYIVTHCSPPGKNHGAEEVSFKGCKVKKIFFGHIHEQSDEGKHCVVGVPNTTRNDERLFDKRYVTIENGKVESHPVPIFYDIVDIDFDTALEDTREKVKDLWEINIKGTPSVREAKRKFKGFNIRDEGIEVIHAVVNNPGEVAVQNFSDSLESDFDEFVATEGLSERVANTCRQYLFGGVK